MIYIIHKPKKKNQLARWRNREQHRVVAYDDLLEEQVVIAKRTVSCRWKIAPTARINAKRCRHGGWSNGDRRSGDGNQLVVVIMVV